jgi:hypothetical protein
MKFPSLVVWFLVLTFGYVFVSHPGSVCAQLPTPNPLIVPSPLPPPPPTLAPIAPAQAGIPSLAIVPTPAASATTPSVARIFNCSCFGPASPTHWMGTVTAPSYFNAQQAAVSACLAYNDTKEPQPPEVTTGQAQSGTAAAPATGTAAPATGGSQLSAVTGLVANQAALASALSAGQQLPSTVTFFATQQLRACSRCACD